MRARTSATVACFHTDSSVSPTKAAISTPCVQPTVQRSPHTPSAAPTSLVERRISLPRSWPSQWQKPLRVSSASSSPSAPSTDEPAAQERAAGLGIDRRVLGQEFLAQLRIETPGPVRDGLQRGAVLAGGGRLGERRTGRPTASVASASITARTMPPSVRRFALDAQSRARRVYNRARRLR